MSNEVCPFCGAQRAATIFAVIWKCGSSTLVGSQGADAPRLRQGTMCRRLCEQQDKIEWLTAIVQRTKAYLDYLDGGIQENYGGQIRRDAMRAAIRAAEAAKGTQP